MADAWGAGLNTLGFLGLGGLVDTAGSLLGDKLTDWISGGSGTDSGGGAAVDAARKAMWDILNNASGITQNSMYNAAGQTGPNVGATYALKADQLTNTAKALDSYNRQLGAADQMLQSTNRNTSLAQQLMGQQMGNMRTGMLNQSAAAGASPAAMAAIAARMGQMAGQGSTQLLGQAGQQHIAALGAAGDMARNAYGTLASDRALGYELGVKPYEAQINQGITGLAGSAGSVAAQANLGQQELEEMMKMQLNPLSGLAKGFGGLGTVQNTDYAKYILGAV